MQEKKRRGKKAKKKVIETLNNRENESTRDEEVKKDICVMKNIRDTAFFSMFFPARAKILRFE